MDVRSFLLFLLLTVSCPALLQAQPRDGDIESSYSSSRGEVEELKNVTLTLLKELLSFSASVKADLRGVTTDLTAVKEDLIAVKADLTAVKADLIAFHPELAIVKLNLSSLWSELDHVANTVVDMKQDVVTTKRKIKAQDVVLNGFQSQLDSIQQAVDNDQGQWLFNQTSAVSALVSQLADRQEVLYLNLSNKVSSVCSVVRGDPPTQYYTTEPPATNESPTSTASATEPVTSATESPTEEGYSCGGTSGWRRVALLNMTDPTHQCPSGWQLTGYSKRTCGRVSTRGRTCDSATFPTGGQNYSRVCGRVVAYQFGGVSAFYDSSRNIESMYVNGLSITHGSPRQHIWTLAGGLAESGSSYISERCPCDGGTSLVPDFVGSDYYCESGNNGQWPHTFLFYPDDRLWDGEDCLPTSSCCEGTLLPYFVKELGGTTSDDIETRICSYGGLSVSDVAIELVEMYVQ